MDFLPDLANETPLWLALVTVGVNAFVGALQASIDDDHHWDIVGMATFGLLMGLGGGFIRDLLIGNSPVESLRTPWFLAVVLGAIVVALVVGERIARLTILVELLEALALGLFSVAGVAYALRVDLPVIAGIFVGVVSAVGGGVLLAVLKNEIPRILLASTPLALVALVAALVYAATAVWDSRAAAVAGIAAALVAHVATRLFGLRTRRVSGGSALLLTRTDRDAT